MDKIVGKLILILFCLTSSLDASVVLRLLNSDGKAISQVAAGEPFIIEAAVNGLGTANKQPDIAGLDAFDVQQSGVRMGNVNGAWSARYSYRITIAKEGNYTIGPASLEHGGKVITSNQLLVRVGTQTRLEQEKPLKEHHAFTRLLVAKKNVVVGQKVTCHLRFYYNDESVRPQQLLKQEHSTIPFKNMRGVNTGTQKLQGDTYAYVEWLFDIYPTEPGTIVIPAQAVDYTKSKEDDSGWAEFSAIFGSRLRTERKRAYSNALKLSVQALPASAIKPVVVGALHSAEASIRPSIGKVGEGIVLSIELEGEGDFDALETLPLVGIPDGLKYYDSKAVLLSKNDQLPVKKRFEFVIQGLKEGMYEIPSQTFSYFEVKSYSYKTVSTQPVPLEIRSGNNAVAPIKQPPHTPEESSSASEQSVQGSCADEQLWVQLRNPVRTQRAMPWWLFVLFLLMPAWFFIRSFVVRLANRIGIWSAERFLFSRARTAIIQAEQDHVPARIHAIITHVIATRLKIPIEQVNADLVAARLDSSAQRADWQEFMLKASAAVYAPETNQDDTIFAQARAWLVQLEKIL